MNAPYEFFSVLCMLETLIILGNQNQSKDLLLRGLKIQEKGQMSGFQRQAKIEDQA